VLKVLRDDGPREERVRGAAEAGLLGELRGRDEMGGMMLGVE
jgi:hypothetical protein